MVWRYGVGLLKVGLLLIFIFANVSCVDKNITQKIPQPSPTITSTSQPSPTITLTSQPSPTITLVPQTSPTVTPFSAGNNDPEIFSVMGIVYDKYGLPLIGVKMALKILSSPKPLKFTNMELFTDQYGQYNFREIYDNTEVELTASKEGYRTVTRNIIIVNYTNPDLRKSYLNFGGDGEVKKYALVKIS